MNELRDVYSAQDDWKGARKERAANFSRSCFGFGRGGFGKKCTAVWIYGDGI